jgi:signal transduction histidine kinase
MRLRVILVILLTVIFSVLVTIHLVQAIAGREVSAYFSKIDDANTRYWVSEMENYHLQNNGWAGIEALLPTTKGFGGRDNPVLHLADASGHLIASNARRSPFRNQPTAGELLSGIPLHDTDGNVIGYLLIEPSGGFSQDEGDNSFSSFLKHAALDAGLSAGALSIALGLVLAYSLIRPVQRLTQAALRMTGGNLAERVPVRGKDELAKLGRAFNQMAEALEQNEQRRRAMTADIAHELRTPLAIQRAHLEALQDGIKPLTIENLQTALDQNKTLERLVDDLRVLAQAEAGKLALEKKPVDLLALLDQVKERCSAAAAAQGIYLNIVKPDSALPIITVDAIRIEQVLNNLIANALRYTPQGGQIVMRLDRSDHDVNITIQDDGPGIQPETLPYIFERFYRADHSRSREDGGTGLGLTIARQLAQAHNGDLTAANAPNGGAIFTLRLPLKS